MDIVNQINYLQKQLDKSIKLLRHTGEDYARAYTEYRIAVAQELVKLKDEDFEKCAKNQSNASLYHLAGDSIVVNVLMAIFKELL